MNLFKKITSRNYWISIGIIVLSILIFQGLVGDQLIKYLHLSEGLILNFLSLLIIITLSKLLSETILETP